MSEPLACYCFKHTEKSVREDREGKILAEVRQAVREGRCDCAEKNPLGVCCLPALVRLGKEGK